MTLQDVNSPLKQEEIESESLLPFDVESVNIQVTDILAVKKRKKPYWKKTLIVRHKDNNGCRHTEKIDDTLELEVLYKICKENEPDIVNLLVRIYEGSVSYKNLRSAIDEIRDQLMEIRKLNSNKHRSVADNNKLSKLSYTMGQTTKNARKILRVL